MSRWLQGTLGMATVALVGVGSLLAVRLGGRSVEPAALATGWALAAVNAVAAWALNRWAMAGRADRFVRRASTGFAIRLPVLAGGLMALLVLTHLQARSLLVAFFGGYLSAIVWEIVLLHRMTKRV